MSAHLRGLESEFGESSNAIRSELNRLEDAGLLESTFQGNRKLFTANRKHPLFSDLHSILLKYTGIDNIVSRVIDNLGDVNEVYLVGDLGKGLDSPIIDLIFIGDLNREYLLELTTKVEKEINKRIRYILFDKAEFERSKNEILNGFHLLLWSEKK